MSIGPRLYVKLKVLINDATWTPISSTSLASTAIVKNAGSVPVLIRTDVDDENTEDSLLPWVQEVVALRTARFQPGVPFLYAKVPAGAGGPLIVTTSV